MNFDCTQKFADLPRLALFAFVAVALLDVNSKCSGATIVAPNRSANEVGTGAQSPAQSGARYLNIYDASEFLSAMPEGGIITGIAFRLDESVQNAVSVTVPSIEIRMSTSPVTASSISMRFADYVGADETIVFPRAPMQFQASTSAVVPHPFSEFIPLATPFTYDPRNGSLAVDLWTFQQSPQTLLIDAGGGALAVGGPVTGDRAIFVRRSADELLGGGNAQRTEQPVHHWRKPAINHPAAHHDAVKSGTWVALPPCHQSLPPFSARLANRRG